MDSLAIVLPTINELENLKFLYPELRKIFPDAIIIVVDDSSSDGTSQFLSDLKEPEEKLIVVSRPRRLGIGSAHLEGIQKAIEIESDYVLTMDADRTHRVSDAELLWRHRFDGDLIVGSRYLEGSQIEGWSVFRTFLTKSGHAITSLFFRTNVDMSSGLRLYKVNQIPFQNLINNCPADYEFFFCSILVYSKLSLAISQCAVVLEQRGAGKSKMSLKLMQRGVLRLLIYGLRIQKIKLC